MSDDFKVDSVLSKNVNKSAQGMDKTKQIISAAAVNDHLNEAAKHAEDIVAYLTDKWGESGFTPEQCVFALSLATINFRDTVPDKFGGKEMFDRMAHEAHKYYHANKTK